MKERKDGFEVKGISEEKRQASELQGKSFRSNYERGNRKNETK
jgi:hypothetical protein